MSGAKNVDSSGRGISIPASTTTGLWFEPGRSLLAKRIMLSMMISAHGSGGRRADAGVHEVHVLEQRANAHAQRLRCSPHAAG